MPIKLSLVIPCCNESLVICDSLNKILGKLSELESKGMISADNLIICVDDGSTDNTWNIIEGISKKNSKVLGIKLSRNVGHQNALLAGLKEAHNLNYDAVISIDADLQDDISVMNQMITKLLDGKEIVYGIRKNRSNDTILKRKSAKLFYNLMKKTESGIIPEHSDFRLLSRRALEMLMDFNERNLFLRGIVPLIGLESDFVYYERGERQAGESKYPLTKMISFAIQGITSFSVRPIRMIFALGFIFLIITLSVLIYVVISMLMGRNIPGWASIMLSLWFIGSLILMALGVIGEYVSKIYIEVKNRPRYFIEKRTGENKENV